MVRGDRGNCILKLRKRPSRLEKGVSLCREEPFFTSKKRPFHLQTIVFTPLSIRRGVGGEAFLHLQTIVFTPLSIRRGGGGEAFLHLQTAVFTPLSIRRGVGGEAVGQFLKTYYTSRRNQSLRVLSAYVLPLHRSCFGREHGSVRGRNRGVS